MMQEVYNISREAMESLRGHLRNPSREQIERREMLMQRLQREVQTVIEGDTETDQFEDLDLSFMKKAQVYYSELQFANKVLFTSAPDKELVGIDMGQTEKARWSDKTPITAA